MPYERTHASFFSGVGGLDMGLERAGWRTVSFSEIDPYASAVLAERWSGVPNLGDIVSLARRDGDGRSQRAGRGSDDGADAAWAAATLWSGGFPCQDLSVAGKRRGFAGDRSSLAFAFLDLVERHRPPALLLENVPGLLSSPPDNPGADFGRLIREVVDLRYGVAWRVLDAQFFGVPQRRRRVFILALDTERGVGADSAAEVLSVGTRCGGHSAAGGEARPGVAAHAGRSVAPSLDGQLGRDNPAVGDHVIGTLREHVRPGSNTDHSILGPPPNSGGVREADGLAGRLDDRRVAATLNSGGNNGGFRTEPGEHFVAFRKATRPHSADEAERWEQTEVSNTVNGWELRHGDGTELVAEPGIAADSDLLPLGLDSHRYRCCGNGVVSDVTYWIGVRLAGELSPSTLGSAE